MAVVTLLARQTWINLGVRRKGEIVHKMSPDELLWTAVKRGGLTSHEVQLVVDHLLARLESLLCHSLVRDPTIYGTSERSMGFSIDFRSRASLGEPLAFQLRGTFGASNYEGLEGQYIGVQGWLYPYVLERRVATTDGHNHIFLRYAKADAGDDDWEMHGCVGEGAWRIIGWEPDLYGEFEGEDHWNDVHT